tara:strand:- start:640 stop:804 length:165 start_codon:yes stop_codon:yes gene_type:complete
MNQKERTKRDEEKAKAKGLVKIHPLIPKDKTGEALAFCKALRDQYGLEKDSDDE